MKIPPARVRFTPEDIDRIRGEIGTILASGQLTLGPWTQRFEEAFARTTRLPHAVAVNSGTSALEIALRILGAGGKEVLMPTNTFFATALAVLHATAVPVFVDADPATFSVDVKDMEARITSRTAGIIVVHIGGIITPRMPEIADLCRRRSLFLLEDAAHAHGSSLDGASAGSFGDAAAYSFYPTKLITSGEGGAIVTRSEKIRDEARLYRDQGKVSFTQNEHGRLGYNWRMSEIHALVGHTHLEHLESFVEERRAIARIYDEEIASLPGIAPLKIPAGAQSNYYKYIALLHEGVNRDRLQDALKKNREVSLSGEVYKLPCHLQPYYHEQYRAGDYPVAERLCSRHVCVPIYNGMTQEEAVYVARSLREELQP